MAVEKILADSTVLKSRWFFNKKPCNINIISHSTEKRDAKKPLYRVITEHRERKWERRVTCEAKMFIMFIVGFYTVYTLLAARAVNV